jgi:uncharacterized protein YjbJ (UPF0337 family)
MAKTRLTYGISNEGGTGIMVSAQRLQGEWNSVRGQVKKKWDQLTDEDLRFSNGNIDQLVGRIQNKTGEAREAIEHYLDELTSQGASAISQAAESAREYAGYAADNMREGYNRMSDRFGRGFDASREIVRDNPARSIAMVLGVGVLLGVFVGLAVRSR